MERQKESVENSKNMMINSLNNAYQVFSKNIDDSVWLGKIDAYEKILTYLKTAGTKHTYINPTEFTNFLMGKEDKTNNNNNASYFDELKKKYNKAHYYHNFYNSVSNSSASNTNRDKNYYPTSVQSVLDKSNKSTVNVNSNISRLRGDYIFEANEANNSNINNNNTQNNNNLFTFGSNFNSENYSNYNENIFPNNNPLTPSISTHSNFGHKRKKNI